jgi:hypothetical protein
LNSWTLKSDGHALAMWLSGSIKISIHPVWPKNDAFPIIWNISYMVSKYGHDAECLTFF